MANANHPIASPKKMLSSSENATSPEETVLESPPTTTACDHVDESENNITSKMKEQVSEPRGFTAPSTSTTAQPLSNSNIKLTSLAVALIAFPCLTVIQVIARIENSDRENRSEAVFPETPGVGTPPISLLFTKTVFLRYWTLICFSCISLGIVLQSFFIRARHLKAVALLEDVDEKVLFGRFFAAGSASAPADQGRVIDDETTAGVSFSTIAPPDEDATVGTTTKKNKGDKYGTAAASAQIDKGNYDDDPVINLKLQRVVGLKRKNSCSSSCSSRRRSLQPRVQAIIATASPRRNCLVAVRQGQHLHAPRGPSSSSTSRSAVGGLSTRAQQLQQRRRNSPPPDAGRDEDAPGDPRGGEVVISLANINNSQPSITPFSPGTVSQASTTVDDIPYRKTREAAGQMKSEKNRSTSSVQAQPCCCSIPRRPQEARAGGAVDSGREKQDHEDQEEDLPDENNQTWVCVGLSKPQEETARAAESCTTHEQPAPTQHQSQFLFTRPEAELAIQRNHKALLISATGLFLLAFFPWPEKAMEDAEGNFVHTQENSFQLIVHAVAAQTFFFAASVHVFGVWWLMRGLFFQFERTTRTTTTAGGRGATSFSSSFSTSGEAVMEPGGNYSGTSTSKNVYAVGLHDDDDQNHYSEKVSSPGNNLQPLKEHSSTLAGPTSSAGGEDVESRPPAVVEVWEDHAVSPNSGSKEEDMKTAIDDGQRGGQLHVLLDGALTQESVAPAEAARRLQNPMDLILDTTPTGRGGNSTEGSSILNADATNRSSLGGDAAQKPRTNTAPSLLPGDQNKEFWEPSPSSRGHGGTGLRGHDGGHNIADSKQSLPRTPASAATPLDQHLRPGKILNQGEENNDGFDFVDSTSKLTATNLFATDENYTGKNRVNVSPDDRTMSPTSQRGLHDVALDVDSPEGNRLHFELLRDSTRGDVALMSKGSKNVNEAEFPNSTSASTQPELLALPAISRGNAHAAQRRLWLILMGFGACAVWSSITIAVSFTGFLFSDQTSFRSSMGVAQYVMILSLLGYTSGPMGLFVDEDPLLSLGVDKAPGADSAEENDSSGAGGGGAT
ncbi:unnamed protein product [Amoebophrya sp. A120]|nr:unnamed protein product [Amoebophrya sp. A120]|eukprot:GSA120T00000703001.1